MRAPSAAAHRRTTPTDTGVTRPSNHKRTTRGGRDQQGIYTHSQYKGIYVSALRLFCHEKMEEEQEGIHTQRKNTTEHNRQRCARVSAREKKERGVLCPRAREQMVTPARNGALCPAACANTCVCGGGNRPRKQCHEEGGRGGCASRKREERETSQLGPGGRRRGGIATPPLPPRNNGSPFPAPTSGPLVGGRWVCVWVEKK